MNLKKILPGVLAGLAVGALIGALIAPDKGSHSRRKIAEKGDEGIDRLKEKLAELVGEVKKATEAVKNKANELTGN